MPRCVYVQVHDRELSWRDAARDLKRNLLVREMLGLPWYCVAI